MRINLISLSKQAFLEDIWNFTKTNFIPAWSKKQSLPQILSQVPPIPVSQVSPMQVPTSLTKVDAIEAQS